MAFKIMTMGLQSVTPPSRYIHNEALCVAEGLAIDEAICESVAGGKTPPTLHLYHYLPCAIVGRYQNTASCLRLHRCEAHGISVNRRITGGGTVFMTPDQMAFGLALPDSLPHLPKTVKGAFEFLAAILARALATFGLQAEFMGKNDLTVGGRKIAGLAISQDMDGVTFFHTSLLVDFDLETMLDILNLPVPETLDRGISCFSERMTTMRRELAGCPITLAEIQEATLRALRNSLGLEFPQTEMAAREIERVRELRLEKYDNDEWIYGVRAPRRRMASAEERTPGGLIQVHLCLSGGVIESILITGDYFSRTREIARLESLLKWTSINPDVILKKLIYYNATEFIHRVDLPIITALIARAANRCVVPFKACPAGQRQ
jgi:lipoate-protein ligase A